jgi:hypothetical protein
MEDAKPNEPGSISFDLPDGTTVAMRINFVTGRVDVKLSRPDETEEDLREKAAAIIKIIDGFQRLLIGEGIKVGEGTYTRPEDEATPAE